MTEFMPVMDRAIAVSDAELRRSLSHFVGGRIRDPDASDDLVQETYLRLCDYRRTRTVANVSAFCFAVARNLINDHLRSRRALPAAELCEDIVCPLPRIDEALLHREKVEVLVGALRVMPPLRREVFMRHRLDGDAILTIAGELELGRFAVEKHVTRALADLRHALERRGLALEW